MKKYYRPAAKQLAVITIGMLLVTICGIILLCLDAAADLAVELAVGGLLLFILFFAVFIIERLNNIQISETELRFSHGFRTRRANATRRSAPFGRVVIKIDDIAHITKGYAGEAEIPSEACTHYTFHMKNGDAFEEQLFPYGKKQEAEILQILEKRTTIR